jgi:hypothetical protein
MEFADTSFESLTTCLHRPELERDVQMQWNRVNNDVKQHVD